MLKIKLILLAIPSILFSLILKIMPKAMRVKIIRTMDKFNAF